MKPALGIVVLLVLSFGTRTVLAAEPVRVAVDWSTLSDATIERCRLGGLQSLLLQTLIEGGFAVVDRTDDQAIHITITEEPTQLAIAGQLGDTGTNRRIRLPQRCDGTIGVELQSGVRSVAQELKPLATTRVPEPPVVPAVIVAPPPAPPEHHLTLSLGGGVSGSRTASLFGVPVLRVTRRTEDLVLGVQLDAGIRSAHQVTVVEPVLSVIAEHRLVHQGAFAIAVGGSVGLLGHAYSADGDSGGHLDARFGVPVDISYAMVTLSAMPTMRLRPVTYRTDDGIAYQADRFGILLALMVRFVI